MGKHNVRGKNGRFAPRSKTGDTDRSAAARKAWETRRKASKTA